MGHAFQAVVLAEEELRHRHLEPDTIRIVLAAATRLLKAAGRSWRRIRTPHVQAFLADRQRTGIKATTQVQELRRLRVFFQALVAAGHLAHDPTAPLAIRPPAPPVHLLLTEKQVARLLAAASVVRGSGPIAETRALRDRAALELIYGLGLRSLEARRMRVTDVNLPEGLLLVRRVKHGPEEWLPLPVAALPHLRAYLGEARPRLARGQDQGQGCLLLQNDGRPLHRTWPGKLVARLVRRAGVRAHPHAFRRAVATHLSQAGMALPAVQQFLGHGRLETTQVYVEVARDELRRAIDALERAMA